MKVYRQFWWGAVLVIGGLGFVVAVLGLPPAGLLVKAFVGVVVGTAACLLIREVIADPASVPSPSSAAVAGALSLVAAAGASEVLSDTAMLLLVVLGTLSSPGACRCYAFLFSPLASPTMTSLDCTVSETAGDSSPLVAAVMVRQLSGEELAAAWRNSGRALDRVAGPDQRLGWVLARQAYLDEFQHRNPGMFDHWLARSADTTDPSRYHFPHPLTGPGSDTT